ncbi:hypothetical protein AB0I91_43545 [Actinosynnema sp. NPDC049800]
MIEQDITMQAFKDAADNRRMLAYLEADEEEDFPETAAHARCAVLEDTLEPLLEAQWPGWLDQVVEAGLATGNKKNALLYLIAARCITSPSPKFLEDVLHRVHRLVG